ncbi:hypothetical protein D9M68_788890 [compost metagenome]
MRSIKTRNNLSSHLLAHALKQESTITINLGNLDCRSFYVNILLRRNSMTTVTLRPSTAPTTNPNSHTYYNTYTCRNIQSDSNVYSSHYVSCDTDSNYSNCSTRHEQKRLCTLNFHLWVSFLTSPILCLLNRMSLYALITYKHPQHL